MESLSIKLNQFSIYLAAPLFSKAEQDFNLKVYDYLQSSGYIVFLPQLECKNAEGESIYQTCLSGLQASSVVVAILDGADADSGTCWECGFAVAQKIPVIAVRTDFRGSGDMRGFNAMLYYSAFRLIESANFLSEIVSVIQVLQ